MSGVGQWRNSYPEESPEKGSNLLAGDKNAGLRTGSSGGIAYDPLWTPEQVARRLNVSPDWVRDHSSRKEPRLPVIRLGGGAGRTGLLRYRASQIEKFVQEMEALSIRNYPRI